MTKQRIGVCLVTVILALGVSPSLAGADGDSLRDKKEKVEQVKDVAEDVGEGDAKDKAKDAAKEEAKDQAGDAAREAAGVGKGPK